MDTDDILLGVNIILILFVVWFIIFRLDSFTDYNARAQTIFEKATDILKDSKSYANYKKTLGGDPVEYSDMKQLYKSGNFNQSSIVNALSQY